MDNYFVWYAHGESLPTHDVGQCSNPLSSQRVRQRIDSEMAQDINDDLGEYTRYEQMVMESMHHNIDTYYQQGPQDPNQSAEKFYTMLRLANEPLWDGSEKASTLCTTTRLLNWKS